MTIKHNSLQTIPLVPEVCYIFRINALKYWLRIISVSMIDRVLGFDTFNAPTHVPTTIK
jgi:hypothetical protein